MSTVRVEKKESYAIVTVDRPKALNALNEDVLNDLHAATQDLSQTPGCRAMLLTGAGEKAFVAGADIAAMEQFTPNEALKFAELGHRTMNAISSSELISIALINGFALGGGLELALACDIRLAGANARMGLPEVTLGLLPGFGGTQRLPRVVGRGLALEMILSGDMIDAGRAYEIGLVNRVLEGDLLAEAEKYVSKMLEYKSGAAQRAARWALHAGMDLPLTAGLQKEIHQFSELFSGSDPQKGMAAFLAKQKPEFES